MVKRILEDYWIPIENPLIGKVAAAFIEAITWSPINPHGLKDIRHPVYIYKNLNVNKGKSYHDGRYAENKKFFPIKFQKIMERKRFNLIFLIIAENNQQYVIKPFQYSPEMDEEWKIANEMTTENMGPKLIPHKFKCNIGRFHGNLIVESCLSRPGGWRPAYLVEKHIQNHKWFISPFANLIKKLHQKGIFFFEDFYTHLFVNIMTHDLKLVDFGMSFYPPEEEKTKRFDIEIGLALDNLKRSRFKPAYQLAFLKIYQKKFRQIKKTLRTDTIILEGKEYKFKRG